MGFGGFLKRSFTRSGDAQGDARLETGAGKLARAAVEDAEGCYRRGAELLAAARFSEAAQALARAVELRHDHAGAQLLLGVAYAKLGRTEDAVDCLLLAICFQPDLPEAHFRLGVIAASQGRLGEAIEYFRRTLEIAPDHAEACNALGAALVESGELEAAGESFARAIEIDPQHVRAHSNLGCLLVMHLDRFDEGAAHITTAWRLAPEDRDVMVNYAMLLQHRGRLDESLALWNRLIELGANIDDARLNRALVALKQGDFARGWPDYEARKRASREYIARDFPFPEWDGAPVTGRTVFIHAEQGLGDQIMFASCIPDIAQLAGHCIVECSGKLVGLFRRAFPAATVVSTEEIAADSQWWKKVSAIDCQVAIGSLPLRFRSSRAAFPDHKGYLHADGVKVSLWRQRLAALGGGRKIGISWRGGMKRTRQSLRSLPLVDWLPVLRRVETTFVSLQYTDCRAELAAFERDHGIRIVHWQEAIDDYDETAALVTALDLVISVQTSIVHLSGALGQPAWVMVPAEAEWRYLQSGESIPWYPSVQVLRQPSAGGWDTVVAAVADRLARAR